MVGQIAFQNIFSHDPLKAHIRDQNHDINDIIMNPRSFQDKDPSLLHTCRKMSWIPSSHTVVSTYLYPQGHLTKGRSNVSRHSYQDVSILHLIPVSDRLKISGLSVNTFFF